MVTKYLKNIPSSYKAVHSSNEDIYCYTRKSWFSWIKGRCVLQCLIWWHDLPLRTYRKTSRTLKKSYPKGIGFQSTFSTSVTSTNYTYAVLEKGVLLSLPWDVILDEIFNSLFVFCNFFIQNCCKNWFWISRNGLKLISKTKGSYGHSITKIMTGTHSTVLNLILMDQDSG